MTNISNRISNEKFFPTKNNSSFPSNFHQNIIKPVHKQMFRIFAHVYWAHFEVREPSHQG
jgi:MOB kinase activator 1